MSEIREKPVHTIRYGNVSAAIWLNAGESGNFYSVTFHRSFKDGERWRESRSFNERDLPNLTKVAADAHSWIVRKTEESPIAPDSEETPIGLDSAALPPSPFARTAISRIFASKTESAAESRYSSKSSQAMACPMMIFFDRCF